MNFKFLLTIPFVCLVGCQFQPQGVLSPLGIAHMQKAGKTIPCIQQVAYGFPVVYVAQAATTFVCHEDGSFGYALELNPRSKTPLWVAEHLTKENLNSKTVSELNDFRPDPDVGSKWQASASDYEGSGFDRGQMASTQDFRKDMTILSKASYLDNVVPQDPTNNKGIWNRLEKNVREWTFTYGEIYVFTGPVYQNGNVKLWLGANKHKNVAAPTHLYKVIYAPKQHQMIAFIIPNDAIDASQLPYYATNPIQAEQIIGYNLFPMLPQNESGILYKVNPSFWPIQ